jgi:hypothetical protein
MVEDFLLVQQIQYGLRGDSARGMGKRKREVGKEGESW